MPQLVLILNLSILLLNHRTLPVDNTFVKLQIWDTAGQ